MKSRLSILLLSVIVVSGGPVFAQSAPPASTTLSLRGTIDSYDAATRRLSLSSPSGIVQFLVASTARVRQGSRTIDAPALGKLVGCRATVRYSESGGMKTVESVHVFGNNERTAQ
jgi:hypothetical protein